VVLAIALIGCGLFRTRGTLQPRAGLGVAAAAVVLLGYGAAGWFGAPVAESREPRAFRLGCGFGVALGIVFAVQIVGEYLAPVTAGADQLIGGIVFGGLLPFSFVLGAIAAVNGPASGLPVTAGRRVRAGVLAALTAMMIGSLAWLNCLLGAYLIFWGTMQERRLFDAESVLADFSHSGEADLRAFLVTDYLGACFFHLTLGPAIATVFGASGALAAAGVIALSRRRRRG
jgi:hypothetical protein